MPKPLPECFRSRRVNAEGFNLTPIAGRSDQNHQGPPTRNPPKPEGTWAQTGPGPKQAPGINRRWAQTGPVPKWALDSNGPWAQTGPEPKWARPKKCELYFANHCRQFKEHDVIQRTMRPPFLSPRGGTNPENSSMAPGIAGPVSQFLASTNHTIVSLYIRGYSPACFVHLCWGPWALYMRVLWPYYPLVRQ